MYLNCKTFFSLRYGTMPASTLLEKAHELGITSLALTNINHTSDAWEFVAQCREYLIKPILGVECRNEHTFKYLLLARNQEGWYHINAFLSAYLQTEQPFPDTAPVLPHTFVIYAWGNRSPAALAPHELLGIRPREVNQLFRTDTAAIRDKLVIMQPVTFQDDTHYELHRLLRAIDQNILISQLEPATTAHPDEQFRTPAQLLSAFEAHPHIVQNTLAVMDACTMEVDFNISRNKKNFTGSVEQDREKLRELALEGMLYRYGDQHTVARQRIEKELAIVAQLNFEAYFLITWDIIRYARERDFFYVGRGSGANSIIAYCLKITDVDPIALDLYFERFLNPYRSSPPDFDIDFSWRDRDEIISYVFEKYGNAYTALLGTVTTFQTNAIIRELGKVYGLPKKEIDKILENGFDIRLDGDDIQKKIQHFSNLMTTEKAFPNHLSIHAGGILISEAPIHHYCTTYLPPKGFCTAQLDMLQAARIGLHKFDILSQRGLGHIRDTIQLVRENKQVEIDIHHVKAFMIDTQVKENLRNVNTIGCFYIESPAMRQLLQKLSCDDYLTLVAASSIIRPGVAQSGMMKQYIQRYHHPEQVVYQHPIIEALLHETFGIMVYQEDVIKVAHHFADMELADADSLRHAMAGKYRGSKDFEKIEALYFANCARLGRPLDVATEVWRQIASFANFSFSKAHSASFAVESYQSLYLKTYFPAEFMVAVINNFGGFYNRELYFRELLKTGVTLHPPCVNNSDYPTKIKGDAVYVGLIHIEGLEQGLAERILENRRLYGAFLHLEDFTARISPAPEQLEILIRIGGFKFTGHTKKELLWKGSLLVKQKDTRQVPAMSLFPSAPVDCQLPTLTYHAHEDAFDEIDLLGFPLTSPFEVLQHDQSTYIPARMFGQYRGQYITTLGYLVTTKFLRSAKGEPMCFGTFLDREGSFIDTTHFPDSLRQYPLQKSGFYVLQGKVADEYGVLSLEINKMRKIGYFEDKKMQ
ncbi:DNA polymerase III subunit alpha [Chitinophaga nivalis]|uniref:DNA-directed DNA polymerase n=1 Tax=Chitinophaga nivalis TaxID=2991709 RepID=A0ABT3IF77_9BACT|nr:DNA polymerase III subunit alpha [Chitinophaga nivalis]MCW3467690.1 DNA polymerase III subunit alpha [Chitinophaga nivalis]MCW3482618.1 DNA polymerase III subunit alpha [Chitinophaga nivalis]